MSGAFGWHKGSASTPDPQDNGSSGHSYEKAKDQYKDNSKPIVKQIGGAGTCKSPNGCVNHLSCNLDGKCTYLPSPNPWPKRTIQTVAQTIRTFPEAKHTLKSNAANVIIAVMDVTSSMQEWPQEVFRRLPLLFNEAVSYFGNDDLEILFIAHGDARTDNFPIQVSRFGKGEELDQILSSFYMKCGGGGQGDESHELVAYYLLKQVDTSSAKNVYTFFVTDEAACDDIDETLVKEHLGLRNDVELQKTADVFLGLRRRMNIFTILCQTKNSRYNPDSIKRRWEANVAKENIIPLDDSRRVVDVMLGTIAKLTGQLDTFTKSLIGRQQGSQFACNNIDTVQKSIALIRAPLLSPKKKTKPLI